MDKWRKIFAHDMFADARMFWHRTSTAFPAPTYSFPFFKEIKIRDIEKLCGVLEIIDRQGENHRGGSDILLSAAVGDGSVVYTGVKAAPRQSYFEQLFPPEILHNEMINIYYPRVRSILNFNQVPDEIYNSPPLSSVVIGTEKLKELAIPHTRSMETRVAQIFRLTTEKTTFYS
ncbi:hypothetical protein ACJJID_06995 [Microbulbifer sp. CnH-101-G]|uniref:hypothetical protein n=1 Tax=Microbulbifer sp. CnH-101-G TaxID=3243393 RepID=UPI00403A1E30